MAGMSKHLALAVFNMSLNPVRAAYNPPDGLWISLHTGAPSDSYYGQEASYAGYARQPINSLTATTSAESPEGDVDITVTNGTAVIFAPSYSATDQTITQWAIWDRQAVGDGNILYSGSLGSSRTVSNGDSVVIPDFSLVLLIK
jgi:hypothetical protein